MKIGSPKSSAALLRLSAGLRVLLGQTALSRRTDRLPTRPAGITGERRLDGTGRDGAGRDGTGRGGAGWGRWASRDCPGRTVPIIQSGPAEASCAAPSAAHGPILPRHVGRSSLPRGKCDALRTETAAGGAIRGMPRRRPVVVHGKTEPR